MQLQTIGRPNSPLFDLFARIIQSGENLPVPVDQGRPLADRISKGTPALKLADGRALVVDGQNVELPMGSSERLTGAAIKAVAGIYRGRILFIRQDEHWRRVSDEEPVKVSDQESFRTEAPPVFQSAPRFTLD